MGYIDKRLAKYAKSGGKFIKLEEGDSFKGTYLTWRFEIDEKYKKERTVFVFKDENGVEKTLGTSAKKFGLKMSKIVPGSLISITRLGEGTKTDYAVRVLKEAKMPLNVEDEEEEEEEEEETPEVFTPKKKKAEATPKKVKKQVVVEEDDEEEDEDDEELFV